LDSSVVIIGILFSLIYYEVTDISPGGIIVPAYLVLYTGDPKKIVITVVIAGVAYGVISLISRYVIIFGRRKFTLMIILSFLIQIAARELFIFIEWQIGFSSIGVIIPGIIASDFEKQGIGKTVFSLGVVVLLMYFTLELYKLSWGHWYG